MLYLEAHSLHFLCSFTVSRPPAKKPWSSIRSDFLQFVPISLSDLAQSPLRLHQWQLTEMQSNVFYGRQRLRKTCVCKGLSDRAIMGAPSLSSCPTFLPFSRALPLPQYLPSPPPLIPHIPDSILSSRGVRHALLRREDDYRNG